MGDWRRVLVSAASDWSPPSASRRPAPCLTRAAFVEARRATRAALAAFARQALAYPPACAAAEVATVVAFLLATPRDVAAAAAISREWRLATRNWLSSGASAPLWRWVVGELCPAAGPRHPALASRDLLLRWLAFPMAVGDVAGWRARERFGVYREPACASQYELAASLAAVFAFLANVGERPGAHRWRAPRFLGYDRLAFEPYLDGYALVGAGGPAPPRVSDVVDGLQAFGVWLGHRDATDAGRVVGDCVERTFRRLVRFLGLARPSENGEWNVDAATAARLDAFFRDYAPMFPQAADARPRDPVTVTRRLVANPWNDLLVPDVLALVGAPPRRVWRFSSARRAGVAWAAAWQAR